MVMQQRPTPEKVTASLVATEDPLNDIQETALYYLEEYVGSLHQELLADFLLFCTGSVLQPSKIKCHSVHCAVYKEGPLPILVQII